MMNNNIEIAILIPTYNPGKILLTVIEEIRKRFRTTPIIIVNDGSSTGTDLLSEIVTRHKDISIINLEENMGKPKAIKKALGKVNADYILLLDDDTIIDADEERIINLIRENPETDLFLFKVRAYKPVKTIEKIQDIEYLISTYSIKKMLGLPLGSIGPGALWKKCTLEKVLDLHDGTFAGDDLQMYLHTLISLRKQESIKYISDVTLYTEPKHGFRDYFNQRVKIWIPGLMHNIRLFLPKLFVMSRYKGELMDAYRWLFTVKLYSVIIKFSIISIIYFITINNFNMINNVMKTASLLLLLYLVIASIRNIIYLYKLLIIIGNGIITTIIALEFTSKITLIPAFLYIFTVFYYIIYYNNLNKKTVNIYNILKILSFILYYFIYNIIIETIGILYYIQNRYK